jgi:hypothetical protein
MQARLFRSLCMVALLTAPNATQACTVKDKVSPSQLVAQADAILRVRAAGVTTGPSSLRKGARAHYDQGPVPMVAFEVVEVVRGDLPGVPLRVVGIAVGGDDWNDAAVPYEFVRPAGRKGMCYATAYRLGAEYLLFFRGGSIYWSPLAPTNEQIHGVDDPWLRWVKREVAAKH